MGLHRLIIIAVVYGVLSVVFLVPVLAESRVPGGGHMQNPLALPVAQLAPKAGFDFQARIEACNRLLEKNGNDIEAYNNRGVFKAQLGDFKGAADDFNAVLRLSPQDADAYTNLGNCRASEGDFASAVDFYSKGINADPQHASSYRERGRVRRMLGDRAGCDLDLKTAAGIYLQRGEQDSYQEIMDELQEPLAFH